MSLLDKQSNEILLKRVGAYRSLIKMITKCHTFWVILEGKES